MQTGFLNFYDAVLGATQQRASLLANNIANADTPGFKAMDIPFNNALSAALGDDSAGSAAPEYRTNTAVGLDGNDVSLDLERVEAVQNGEQMTAAATFLHQATADMITALRPNPNGS